MYETLYVNGNQPVDTSSRMRSGVDQHPRRQKRIGRIAASRYNMLKDSILIFSAVAGSIGFLTLLTKRLGISLSEIPELNSSMIILLGIFIGSVIGIGATKKGYN